jgi:TusA-related sulfurtransferase
MSESDITAETTVDARGAACPGPLMELISAIRDAESGTVIRLQSDNDQSRTDVPEWADETDNELREITEVDEHYEFYVEKA